MLDKSFLFFYDINTMKEKRKYFSRHSYNKGSDNPNWKGGVSEYPDHYLMKKIRLEVLGEANHICQICGNKATEIHHKDLSKDNHSKENFIPVCHGCQMKFKRPYTSKYKRLYGFTFGELRKMGVPWSFFYPERKERWMVNLDGR